MFLVFFNVLLFIPLYTPDHATKFYCNFAAVVTNERSPIYASGYSGWSFHCANTKKLGPVVLEVYLQHLLQQLWCQLLPTQLAVQLLGRKLALLKLSHRRLFGVEGSALCESPNDICKILHEFTTGINYVHSLRRYGISQSFIIRFREDYEHRVTSGARARTASPRPFSGPFSRAIEVPNISGFRELFCYRRSVLKI